jgi:hypothetical protein
MWFHHIRRSVMWFRDCLRLLHKLHYGEASQIKKAEVSIAPFRCSYNFTFFSWSRIVWSYICLVEKRETDVKNMEQSSNWALTKHTSAPASMIGRWWWNFTGNRVSLNIVFIWILTHYSLVCLWNVAKVTCSILVVQLLLRFRKRTTVHTICLWQHAENSVEQNQYSNKVMTRTHN